MQLCLGNVDAPLVALLQIAAQFLHEPFNAATAIAGKLHTKVEGHLPQQALGLEGEGLGSVALLDPLSLEAIGFSEFLRLTDHALYFALFDVRSTLHHQALLPPGGFVHRRHLENAVGVDIKGHQHLGHPTGGRGNAHQLKPAQGFIVGGHFPLSLEHMHLHGGLVVLGGGENIRSPHRNGGVAGNHLLHHAADGL